MANLEKGHTRADVLTALEILRVPGIAFRPTWVAFSPWATLDDYLFQEAQLGRYLTLDFLNPGKAARQVEFAATRPLDAVVGVDDATTVLAATLSAALSLRHNSVASSRGAGVRESKRKEIPMGADQITKAPAERFVLTVFGVIASTTTTGADSPPMGSGYCASMLKPGPTCGTPCGSAPRGRRSRSSSRPDGRGTFPKLVSALDDATERNPGATAPTPVGEEPLLAKGGYDEPGQYL